MQAVWLGEEEWSKVSRTLDHIVLMYLSSVCKTSKKPQTKNLQTVKNHVWESAGELGQAAASQPWGTPIQDRATRVDVS